MFCSNQSRSSKLSFKDFLKKVGPEIRSSPTASHLLEEKKNKELERLSIQKPSENIQKVFDSLRKRMFEWVCNLKEGSIIDAHIHVMNQNHRPKSATNPESFLFNIQLKVKYACENEIVGTIYSFQNSMDDAVLDNMNVQLDSLRFKAVLSEFSQIPYYWVDFPGIIRGSIKEPFDVDKELQLAFSS